MKEYVDMHGFDELSDNLEEWVSKQGFTLGNQADSLQKLMESIAYCYIHGVATESQREQMNRKFVKQFQDALMKKERTKMTNLEWLRSMSIDEWAEVIYQCGWSEIMETVRFCKDKPECDDYCPDPDTMCIECVKEWLMEERERV